jgi:hypothetical protein
MLPAAPHAIRLMELNSMRANTTRISSSRLLQELPEPAPADHGVSHGPSHGCAAATGTAGWDTTDIRAAHVPGHEFVPRDCCAGQRCALARRGAGDGTLRLRLRRGAQCLPESSGVRAPNPARVHPLGSFAEYVAIDHAEVNLVRLPGRSWMTIAAPAWDAASPRRLRRRRPGPVTAGSGGARLRGVGLSAVMIAQAVGANVVAVDITAEKLALAWSPARWRPSMLPRWTTSCGGAGDHRRRGAGLHGCAGQPADQLQLGRQPAAAGPARAGGADDRNHRNQPSP